MLVCPASLRPRTSVRNGGWLTAFAGKSTPRLRVTARDWRMSVSDARDRVTSESPAGNAHARSLELLERSEQLAVLDNSLAAANGSKAGPGASSAGACPVVSHRVRCSSVKAPPDPGCLDQGRAVAAEADLAVRFDQSLIHVFVVTPCAPRDAMCS